MRDHTHLFDWRWRKRGSKVGHLFNRAYVRPTSLCGSIRSSTYLDTDVDYVALLAWQAGEPDKSECERCQRKFDRLGKLQELEAEAKQKRAQLETDAKKLAMSGIPPFLNPFERKVHHDEFSMTEKDLENAKIIHVAQVAAWGPGAVNPKTARIGVWGAVRMCVLAGLSEEDVLAALREDFARERAEQSGFVKERLR